jgi:cold-inducible RNA-binding protein
LDCSGVGWFLITEVALPTSIRNRLFVRLPFFSEAISIRHFLKVTAKTADKVKIIMSMKLYVGNLSFQTSSYDLEEMFAAHGTVESANVVEDRETGRSRGFGFVEMSSKEEGENAISELNGKDLNGRTLTVNEAKPREDRGGNRGGGNNRGGGFGGGRGGGNNRGGGFGGGKRW